MQTITGSHSLPLVVLSILVSAFASYTALDLANRARSAASDGPRRAWLLSAAGAMGAGIWAMHFVGMLAFHLGTPTSYDVGLTALSLAVAVLATGTGFLLVGPSQAGGCAPARLVRSGIVMGLGIVAMHYTGMAAMQLPADIHYDPPLVAASVAIAIGAAVGALWLALLADRLVHRVGAAALMAAATAGMHYTGIAAASFHAHGHAEEFPLGVLQSELLAAAVAAITFIVLVLALLAAVFDRRVALLAARDAEALRQSEQRFRAWFDHAPDQIFMVEVGSDGTFRYGMINPATTQFSGIRTEEARGRTAIDLLGPAGAALEARYAECVARGEPIRYDQRVAFPAGTRDLDTILVPLRDADGRVMKILGTARDVTEIRKIEERLRQAQKIQAVGQLTGGVAHDFNNLLTAVLGNLELLLAGEEDPAKRKKLENARRSAERGAKLVQQLLAFSRQQHLQPRPVSVADLISGMNDLMQRTIGAAVTVRTVLPADLRPVVADPNQLELVVLNLAINARDAMPLGGTLTIEAANAGGDHPKRPAELPEGDYVQLSVSDTGTGMSEEVKARAFEPFFTTKDIGKGSGLGLAQVYGVAQQSGGAVRIETQPGRGTTVLVYLPCAAAVPTSVPAPVQTNPPTEAGVRVLLVDDDADVREIAATYLRDLGHQVVEAESGWAALEKLRADSAFDLLVADVAMPGLDGAETARLARKRRPDLPVLFITGFAEPGALEQKIDGAEVVRKPFKPAELAAAVHAAFGRDMESRSRASNVLPLRPGP